MDKTELQKQTFKWLFRAVMGIIIFAILGIGYVTYLVVKPEVPLTINSVQIINSPVSHDGSLIYRFNYCKHVHTFAVVYRQILPVSGSGSAVAFPAVLGITQYGCHITDIVLPLPNGIVPGTYQLKGHLVYTINSFRTASVDYLTPPFQIK